MSAIEWEVAGSEVTSIAQELIRLFHPNLSEARIGFLFRSKAPRTAYNVTLGKCQKVSSQNKTLLDLDYIIWVAKDIWEDLNPDQRKALIDHELCHAAYSDGECKTRHHDFEEFNDVIQRWGLWNQALFNAGHALKQATLNLPVDPPKSSRGAVIAVNPNQAAGVLGDDWNPLNTLVENAVHHLQGQTTCSISKIQRLLRVGYPTARKVIDRLQEIGILGPQMEGQNGYPVLRSEQEPTHA